MIVLDHVGKCFHNGGGSGPAVLQDVSLTFKPDRFVCLLGPSGCGKTTLLNLVAGFLLPSAGQVLFRGQEVRQPGPDRGVVFQDATLFPWMTVLDNVRFGPRQQGLTPKHATALAEESLTLVGMSAQAMAWPASLSGGMRQRVAIARILALRSPVMLFDEPFSALDANSRERLQDELLRICASRPATVLYITHNVEEAAFLAERVIVMGPAPNTLRADILLPSPRPRPREGEKFHHIKKQLRAVLDELPCCIAPVTPPGPRT